MSSSPADSFKRNPEAPAANGVGGDLGVVMHREQDDSALEPLAFEPSEHIETTQARHREVRNNQVRSKPPGGVQEEFTISNGADHVEAASFRILARPSVTIA